MRRRRRNRTKSSLGSVFLGAVALVLILDEAWVALGLFVMLVVLVWVAFFKPTLCDVETKTHREACGTFARGRLRACHLHKRHKRDALWALFGMKNPGVRYRLMWARSRSGHGSTSPISEAPSPRVTRPGYDATMLVATMVGSVATAVSLAVQLA